MNLSDELRKKLFEMHEKSLNGKYIPMGDFRRIEDMFRETVRKIKGCVVCTECGSVTQTCKHRDAWMVRWDYIIEEVGEELV